MRVPVTECNKRLYGAWWDNFNFIEWKNKIEKFFWDSAQFWLEGSLKVDQHDESGQNRPPPPSLELPWDPLTLRIVLEKSSSQKFPPPPRIGHPEKI